MEYAAHLVVVLVTHSDGLHSLGLQVCLYLWREKHHTSSNTVLLKKNIKQVEVKTEVKEQEVKLGLKSFSPRTLIHAADRKTLDTRAAVIGKVCVRYNSVWTPLFVAFPRTW